LASIWRQLASRHGRILDDAKALYGRHQKLETEPLIEEILEILKREMGYFSRVFILVDALDECSGGSQDWSGSDFLSELCNLPEMASTLITSRHNDDLARDFPNSVTLPIEARANDLELYIKGRLKKERRLLQILRRDPTLEKEIVETIVRKADQM
jgi:hypothetical protein